MKFLASLNLRRAAIIIGTLLVAFGSGHYMQNVLVLDEDVAVVGGTPEAAPSVRRAGEVPSFPVPPAATLVPMPMPMPDDREPLADEAPVIVFPQEDASLVPKGAPCRAVVRAEAKSMGLVQLVIEAPCHQGANLLIKHAGLSVDHRLDDAGRSAIDFPVLTDPASISVTLPDMTERSVSVDVPELSGIYRAALAWDGEQIAGLHTLEGAAGYGDAGHIHALNPGSAERGRQGGGFLVRLGDGWGGSAEIYTFPREDAFTSGLVRLSAEIEVTSETCERRANARAIQTDALGGLASADIVITTPDCTALGEIVVLDRVYSGLELAAR